MVDVDGGSFHPKYIFLADKQNRTLSVWGHKNGIPVLIAYYPMDIGKNSGDKAVGGDDRTPVGIYFIQERREMAKVNYENYGIRAFTLNYPNFFDRFEGKSGYGIWLHAIPETKTLRRGSEGCVVVRNDTIRKLTPLVTLKRTPVIILDHVNYVTPEQLAKNRQAALAWLESWRHDWETKNLDAYMDHYAHDFKGRYKSLKMDKRQWRRYKGWLNKRYKSIHVAVRNPFVLTNDDQAIFHFIQVYHSSGKNDTGEKTLYARRTPNGQYKILSEVWGPLGPDANPEKAPALNVSAEAQN